MKDRRTHVWKGASGREYTYWVYKLPINAPAKPGNYILATAEAAGGWKALYIGQAQDLSVRFDDHHGPIDRALAKATHIHLHTSSASEEERLREEKDLVRGIGAVRG